MNAVLFTAAEVLSVAFFAASLLFAYRWAMNGSTFFDTVALLRRDREMRRVFALAVGCLTVVGVLLGHGH